MITPVDAKFAYVYATNATRLVHGNIHIGHDFLFDAADSDDEAYGRAMRYTQLRYPSTAGWSNHFAMVRVISGIAGLGRCDLTKTKPAETK